MGSDEREGSAHAPAGTGVRAGTPSSAASLQRPPGADCIHRNRCRVSSGDPRPTVGLVRGGGGARGAAHVGVLAVLEELRIPVDFITGTSMGSIVGGLYAGGLSPEELRGVVEGVDWVEIFQDRPPRQQRSFRRKQDDLGFLTSARFGIKNWRFFVPPGFMQGQQLDFLLRSLNLTSERMLHFEDLHIPFRTFATEIGTGEVVSLQTGDVARAMRASMSIPGAFSPVEIDGRTLVDGGIVRNLPIGDVMEMGADVVIAVDVSTALRDGEDLSALGITSQILTIQIQDNQRREIAKLRAGDVLIRPEMEGIGTASFARMGSAIQAGRDAATQALKALERYSLSPAAYEEWRRTQRRIGNGTPVISEVRIDNESLLSSAVIAARLRTKIGESLDLDQLKQDIGTLYGLDAFERVTFDVRREATGSVLLIRATAKNRGLNYIRLGLRLASDFKGASAFDFGLNHVMYPINRKGGEWRNEFQVGSTMQVSTELYQPLDSREWFFVQPVVGVRRSRTDIFDTDGTRRARYFVTDVVAGADVGVNLSNVAQLFGGLSYFHGETELDTGDPALFPDARDGGGTVFIRLDYDTLDTVSFPNDGSFLRGEAIIAREALGWSKSFETLRIAAIGFRTFSGNTVSLAGEYGTSFGIPRGDARLFSLGGFLRLSGFQVDELRDNHYGLIRVMGYRRLATPTLFAWRFPVYLGASFEAGNVWKDRNDIGDWRLSASGFFGYDTPLGPLYVGYAWGEGGRNRGFLLLGRPF